MLFRRHRSPRSLRQSLAMLACVLGFLVGQWFAVAHATQHELEPDGSAYCQICAIAHAAGGAASPPPAPGYFVPSELPPPVRTPAAPALRPASRTRCRAPPACCA